MASHSDKQQYRGFDIHWAPEGYGLYQIIPQDNLPSRLLGSWTKLEMLQRNIDLFLEETHEAVTTKDNKEFVDITRRVSHAPDHTRKGRPFGSFKERLEEGK
jgi:hypothetical protein